MSFKTHLVIFVLYENMTCWKKSKLFINDVHQALNRRNKLNVAPSSMHLQYNAQQKKKKWIFFITYTMINVISIFLTQELQRKKTCDVLVRILPSTQRFKVESLSQ